LQLYAGLRVRDCELEFDLLAPWIAGTGQVYWTRTERADTHRRVDAILRQIEGG
jgi:hypothetical protein